MHSLERSTVVSAVEILRARGPMPREQWLAAMVTAGLGTRSELKTFSEGNDDQSVGRFEDGRVCAMEELLEGRILTHRLTEADIRSGLVNTFPDLTPMSLQLNFEDASGIRVFTASRNAAELADLNRDEPEEDAVEAFVLPPQVRHAARVGDILGLRFRGGRVHIEDVGGIDLGREGLQAPLRAMVPHHRSAVLDGVMWQLMDSAPAMFTRPTLPIGELLAAAGYEAHVNLVAVRGFDFWAEFLWNGSDDWAQRFNLDIDCVAAIWEVLRLLIWLESGELSDRRALAAVVERQPDLFTGLSSRAACQAVLEVASELDHPLEDVRMIARVLGRLGPEAVRCNARWMAAEAERQSLG